MAPNRRGTKTPPKNEGNGEQRNNRYAEAWRPEDGDAIEGRIMRWAVGSSKYGKYPICVIKQNDGSERSIHAFHGALRSQFENEDPQVGEVVHVERIGKRENVEGTYEYVEYAVTVTSARKGRTSIHDVMRHAPARPVQNAAPLSQPDDDLPF